MYSCHLFLISSASVRYIHFCHLLCLSLHEMFPWYLNFSWRDPSSFPFYCFPLFLCTDHWGRLSYLSLLFLELCIQMGVFFLFSKDESIRIQIILPSSQCKIIDSAPDSLIFWSILDTPWFTIKSEWETIIYFSFSVIWIRSLSTLGLSFQKEFLFSPPVFPGWFSSVSGLFCVMIIFFILKRG